MAKNTNPNQIARTLRVSRDAILATRDPKMHTWVAKIDGGADLRIVSFQKRLGVGFAMGRHGNLYLVVQTGEAKLSNWKVRVAIYPAHDDGTDKLCFATSRMGGYVNQGVVR